MAKLVTVERNVKDKYSQIQKWEDKMWVFPLHEPSLLVIPEEFAKQLVEHAPKVFKIVETVEEPEKKKPGRPKVEV
jgi:hypothetical protein